MSKIPLLIVEGPDCAGKTTLCKFLTLHYPAIYLHCTYTEALRAGMADHQQCILESALCNIAVTENSVVIDRHWPSQVAYSRVFRPNDDNSWCDTMHQMILGCGGKYILCMDSDVVDRHDMNKSPSHPYSASDFTNVCLNYQDIFNNMHEDHVIRYDLLEHGSDLNKFMREYLLND